MIKRERLLRILKSKYFISGLVVSIIVLFVPLLYSTSNAESVISNDVVLHSERVNNNPLYSLFKPQYYILSKNENSYNIDFVAQNRKFILMWDNKLIESHTFVYDGELAQSDEEIIKDILSDDVLSEEEINFLNDLKFGNFSKVNEDALEYYEDSVEPDVVLSSLESYDETWKIEILRGEDFGTNYVKINDEKIDSLKNVDNLHFNLNQDTLYYSKYKLDSDHGSEVEIEKTQGGKIYQYNLLNKTEDTLYNFNTQEEISFRANSRKILYVNSDPKITVIDLNNGTDQEVDLSNIYLPDVSEFPSHDEFLFMEVIDIGEEHGLISVTLPDPEGSKIFYKVNLNTLEITEE